MPNLETTVDSNCSLHIRGHKSNFKTIFFTFTGHTEFGQTKFVTLGLPVLKNPDGVSRSDNPMSDSGPLRKSLEYKDCCNWFRFSSRNIPDANLDSSARSSGHRSRMHICSSWVFELAHVWRTSMHLQQKKNRNLATCSCKKWICGSNSLQVR